MLNSFSSNGDKYFIGRRHDVSNIKCVYTNADCFMNKVDEFKSRFNVTENNQPDIIMITEVLPKNIRYEISKSEISLDGYECERSYYVY